MNTDVFKEDVNAVVSESERLYTEVFAAHFKEVRELRKRLESTVRPVTDDELSQILLNLPMQLFSASETLSQFKTSLEVLKLKMKEQEAEIMRTSTARTITEKRAEADSKLIEAKVTITLYKSVIARVDDEIDLAKELIMGAKKIWDARRKTEQVNPVSPPGNIPAYKTPIFGGEQK